jgi:hypothetical protein
MKRTTKYVALDVHQATTAATVRISGGRVIARSVLPTEACAITAFVAGMRGSIHVAFEVGTQAQWLHDLLSPRADRVVVCDRRGEHRGNKADRLDADKLSQRLLTGDLRPVYHGSTDRATLRELAHTYSNLVEDATRVMLRLKAQAERAAARRRPDLERRVPKGKRRRQATRCVSAKLCEVRAPGSPGGTPALRPKPPFERQQRRDALTDLAGCY